VSQVFEELQLSVRSLAEYGSGEGLHDLLDGDRGGGELVFGRAVDLRGDIRASM